MEQTFVTSQIIKLMNRATGVTFRHHKGTDARGEIGLIQSLDGGLETRTEIELPSKIYVYGKASHNTAADASRCFEYISSAKYCDNWQAVCAVLKAGDRISLHWVKGALVHENLRAIGGGTDQLFLTVCRGTDKRARYFKLHLSTAVTTPATTYPMIEVAA